MDFERVVGLYLGKWWCLVFEEWLVLVLEDESLVSAGDGGGDALAKKLRAKKKDVSDEVVDVVVCVMMMKVMECVCVMRNEFCGLVMLVLKEERVDGVVSLRVGKIEVRLNGDYFEKLKMFYVNVLFKEFVENDFLFDVFVMVCWYDVVVGG